MKRKDTSFRTSSQRRAFLNKNPKIAEALRIFDISYAQYEKALEESIYYYTSSSTQGENL